MDTSDFDEATTAIAERGTSEKHLRFLIRVVSGPDQGATVEVDFEHPPVIVGQGPAASLELTDREVSRRHLSLEATGTSLRVRDLGSTNGTFLQGMAVVEAFAGAGDTLRVGATTLRVEVLGEASTAPPLRQAFQDVIGASLPMRRMYPLVERLARSSIPVLIEGETGTGKEVLAEAIHEASERRAAPFVVFDCTAVPHSLLESELFGHERGAFTGAHAARRGVFELAHGGTLFIDEIGDLDPVLQPKLLRALERSEVRRLGAERSFQVDVRVLAATRRNLDDEVQNGRFRDDLFHRLVVGRISLPPLRERTGDVRLLVRHFWTRFGGRGAPPERELCQWESDEWPGNVRQLRNAVARYIALDAEPSEELVTDGEVAEDFIDGIVAKRPELAMGRMQIIEEYERRYIAAVLADHGGNVSRAAKASGIGRRYFQILKASRR